MEVGLFFMPKIKRILWRWKLCAQELHWHVQNASSVITTWRRKRKLIRIEWKPKSIADFAESILYTRKPNNSDWAKEV